MIITLMYVFLGVLSLAVVLVVGYLAVPFRYPSRTESDYSYHTTPWWQLYYAHKYLRPRVRAERGAGLEDYFGNMAFRPQKDGLSNCREVTLCAVGDLMQRPDLRGQGGVHLWDQTGEWIFGNDLTIGNLEFAVSETILIQKVLQYSVPPAFAAPLLGDERFGRFHYLSLGNNHINDAQHSGVCSTCNYLDAQGVMHSGANRTPEEGDQFPIFEKAGAAIALLSYTFSTNGVPIERDHPYCVNVVRWNALNDGDFDDSLVRRHIAVARERGANYLVCNNHWCIDHEFYPPARVVERTHRLFEAGIDVVIGHHPHLVGPVEVYQASDGRQCMSCYSLGSLTTFWLPFSWQRLSQAIRVVLEVGEDGEGVTRVRPRAVSLMPLYHSTRSTASGKENRLISVEEGFRAITSNQVPDYFSGRDVRAIERVHAFHRRHVRCEGMTRV